VGRVEAIQELVRQLIGEFVKRSLVRNVRDGFEHAIAGCGGLVRFTGRS
jgi:hypothetical protein